MRDEFARIGGLVEGEKESLVRTLARMIEIKAISPESGGSGEAARADFLQRLLTSWGFGVGRYDYLDKKRTKRSNLIVKFGDNERTLWIIAHMDTVSEGDVSLWKTDPFKAKIVGDRVYGRGALDNGQSLMSAMFALKTLRESGVKTRYNLGLALVADEELESEYGVKKLLKEKIFGKEDLVLVPDAGNPRGDKIEISEKSVLWLRIKVRGKQVHASMPQKGENAYRYAIRFLGRVDEFLHKKYNAKDSIFATPSTFEMTKHEKNVDSINIVPGTEVSYIDCRVLPRYSLDSVLGDIKRIARSKDFGKVRMGIEVVQRSDAARPTSEKSEIVRALKRTLGELRGVDAGCVGIGGGTVAKHFRDLGMQAAVWSTIHDIAHQPNEYCIISYALADAKVFACLCI